LGSLLGKEKQEHRAVVRLRTGLLGFDSGGGGAGNFLFTTASRKAVGPTQPPIQWVSGALYVGLKRLGRKADNSLASSADVTNTSTYTSTPPIHTPSRRGAQIKQVSVIRLGIPVPLYCDVI